MDYYEKLNIDNYLGHEVIIVLGGGEFHVGILTDGLINEDWKEDGEKETLALQIGGNLIGFELDSIEVIAKVSDVSYAKEAV